MSNFGSRISGFFGGASGGGGGGLTSVAVDGTTIQGDGTIGDPLFSTTALPVINMGVDLAGGDYDLGGAGIYSILYFGNAFLFNDIGIVDGSRVILTNSNLDSVSFANINGDGVSVRYQGTQIPLTGIPSGMTYEFIFDQSNSIWYCLNPQPQPTTTDDIGGFVNPYLIREIGYYKFLNTGGGAGIDLPTPTALIGQEMTIFNVDPTDPIIIASNTPTDLDGTSVAQIAPQTCLNIVAIDGEWLVINIRTV